MTKQNHKRSFAAITATVAAALSLTAAVPMAFADNTASEQTAVATRSFPKMNVVKKNLYAEATSTSVNDDTKWGGIEALDVPQTKSTAEKEAEAAAQQKAQEEAEAQAAAQQKAQDEATAAANRSQTREDTTTNTNNEAASTASSSAAASSTAAPAATGSATGASIAALAQQYVGAPYVSGGTTPAGWDCSGFVMWVYAQFGISLPRTSGAQATVGTAVPSIAQAQPGDIIANAGHAAIYIGGGMVVNALNPAQGTMVTSVAGTSSFAGGYSIRRVV